MSNQMFKGARALVAFAKENGWRKAIQQVRMMNIFRTGTLKGTDQFGNKYYEDNTSLSGMERFVIFPDYQHYDASQVPPEWHMWLHNMRDETPVDSPPFKPKFQLEHKTMNGDSFYGQKANYLPPRHPLKRESDFRKPKYTRWSPSEN